MLTSVQRHLVMIAAPITSECMCYHLKMSRCRSLAPHVSPVDTLDGRVVSRPTLLTGFFSCYLAF